MHQHINDALHELPDPYRGRALANRASHPLRPDLPGTVGDAVFGAFLWDSSDQGDGYWRAVHERYRSLARPCGPVRAIHRPDT